MIDQVPVPVGVAPPLAPATVAVNINVDPSAVVDALVVTVTVGVILVIAKLNALEGPALV